MRVPWFCCIAKGMEQDKTPCPRTKVIAVDGGGSRCRLALVGGDLNHRIELGAANATSDFDGALATCCEGLSKLATKAGMTVQDLRPLPAYFGLAGITNTEQAERFSKHLPLDHVRVEEDRSAAVTGALGLGDGAVIHAGTGSFVARRHNGQLRCVGGWGPKLGDEGSAHWIGREVLRVGLALSDGLLSKSALGQSVLDRFDGATGAILFATGAPPTDIAALAPLLLNHKADPHSQDIMIRAAAYFSDTLKAVGWEDEPICPTGALAPHLGPFLPAAMRNALHPPAAEPIEGAILLARQWAKELAT